MSVRLLGRAFYADLPGHLKLLLLALCDESNDDGVGICVGQQRLALKCGTTDRSIRSNLGTLVETGWLVKLADRHPKYGTDQYEIAVERLPVRPENVPYNPPEESSGPPQRPEVQRPTDRKSSVVPTGSPLPPTREIPVQATREELDRVSAFGAFWTAYPRKVGKPKAEAAYRSAVRRADPQVILAGALRYANDPNRYDGFTAHPTTWLNRDGWDDPPLPSRVVRSRRPGLQTDDLLRMATQAMGEGR